MDACALYNLDTLEHRRSISMVMFLYDLLTLKLCSEKLLSRIRPNPPQRINLRARPPLVVDLHRTNYGANEPSNRMCRELNRLAPLMQPGASRGLFDSLCLDILARRS